MECFCVCETESSICMTERRCLCEKGAGTQVCLVVFNLQRASTEDLKLFRVILIVCPALQHFWAGAVGTHCFWKKEEPCLP